jgi:LPS sulfotransferase NodH
MGEDRGGGVNPLEGIETGYEERYDFPFRDGPPERAYMLATVPRTGSSYLSHLLWKTGCLGAPLEYLNFLPSGPSRLAIGRPDEQTALWRSLLHLRTSPNGVFGVKAFSLQLRELQQRNPALLREVFAMLLLKGPAARVIRLKRRDSVAHAISYARAARSGIWRKEQEKGGGSTVDYSAAAVEQARAALDRQEADWDLLLDELKIGPLTLWYEDVAEQPKEAVRGVAAYLGVELDPAATIAVPAVERQADEDSKRWSERHAAGQG